MNYLTDFDMYKILFLIVYIYIYIYIYTCVVQQIPEEGHKDQRV